MNPILSREIRLRWRDNRSFLLLFVLCGALSIVLGIVWNGKSDVISSSQANSQVLSQLAGAGRELFNALTIGQCISWFLMAPALTASSIALERERGLLESLWLSQLHPRALIWGRLGSTLAFVFSLQIALVPLLAICLLLGGVAPSEIFLSLGLGMTTAFCGAAIGLWSSARSHRPAAALSLAFGFLLLWSVGAYGADELLSFGAWVVGKSGFTLRATIENFTFLIRLSHPLFLIHLLASGATYVPPGVRSLFTIEGFCELGAIFQIGVASLLLFNATRRAARPLPQAGWAARNPIFEKWRKNRMAHLAERKRLQREKQERARLHHHVEGALLAELPIDKLVNFKNPLLRREVRARFRLRRVGLVASLARLAIVLAATSFWLGIGFMLTDQLARLQAGDALLMVLLGVGALAIAVMAARSFTGEREAGTWEGLRLSLMPAWEIATAKWLSPLVTCLYYGAPLLVLLPFCVAWSGKTGIAPRAMVLSVLVVISGLLTICAFGLWVSRRSRSTPVATVWTLGVLLVVGVGAPAFQDEIESAIHGTFDMLTTVFAAPPDTDNEIYRVDAQWFHESMRVVFWSYHPTLVVGELLTPEPTAQEKSNYPDDFSEFRDEYEAFRDDSLIYSDTQIVGASLVWNALLSWWLLFLVSYAIAQESRRKKVWGRR